MRFRRGSLRRAFFLPSPRPLGISSQSPAEFISLASCARSSRKMRAEYTWALKQNEMGIDGGKQVRGKLNARKLARAVENSVIKRLYDTPRPVALVN